MKLATNNGRTVTFLDPMTYDLMQFAFFPVNMAINTLCYLQPKKAEWNEAGFEKQDVSGTGESLESVTQSILGQADIAYNEEDLVRLYDSLPAVGAQKDLIGRTWRGKILRTNNSVLDLAEWAIIRPLSLLGITWGKRYRTADVGDPLLFNWQEKVYAPVPIWGNVGMTDIRWRGVPTATMNYDHQPWKDYFKLLSDKNGEIVLLGIWTHKQISGGWFALTLDQETPAD